MDKLYKSYSVFHQESNKLGLHFSDFSMFLCILQDSAKGYYLRFKLLNRPLEVSEPSQISP
jgi:hypothetical protein